VLNAAVARANLEVFLCRVAARRLLAIVRRDLVRRFAVPAQLYFVKASDY
jgi:hypothetical protein